MTLTQTESTATDAVIPSVSQEPSLTVGPSALDRLLARGRIRGLAVLAALVNPTSALVLSQVVLSFGISFALTPLVILTSRRDVMGPHVNRSGQLPPELR